MSLYLLSRLHKAFTRNIFAFPCILSTVTGIRALSVLKKSTLLSSTIQTQHKRHFMSIIYKMVKKPSAERLKRADEIPDYYTLIYKTSITRYLFLAQLCSVIPAAIVTVYMVLNSVTESDSELKQMFGGNVPPIPEDDRIIYLSCFFVVCAVLQLMLTRVPIRIYSYLPKEKYRFVFYGPLPFTKRIVQCKINEVIHLEERGILPWRESRFYIKDKRNIIMLEGSFRKPADLNIMLGYQSIPDGYD